MALKHKLLAATFRPLRFANALHRQVVPQRPGRLRVLIYHDIPPEDEAPLAAQLQWLSRSWRFITTSEFEAILSGARPIIDDCLLLSFDDGFASNRRVAETVLKPLNIKAMFFIVSEFAALSDEADWRGFISQNICPGWRFDETSTQSRNMNWSDLVYLLDSGHSIGAHTAHHARLAEVASSALASEIILSADALENRLGTKIEHFAYTFGDLASFGPEALSVARSRFSYIYTGLRGNNAVSVAPWAIRRDAMAARDSLSLVGALLEGGADWSYSNQLAIYESWGRGG